LIGTHGVVFVFAHQPRVSRHIGNEDRGKPSLDVFFSHAPPSHTLLSKFYVAEACESIEAAWALSD
jgi:hypothetical protein